MRKKIGVVLSGCGVRDGSEIHEAVLALLAIDRNNGEAICMAPNEDYPETNHLTMQETGGKRNALVEAARIARGNIRDIKEVKAAELDALVFPGGYGAARTCAISPKKGLPPPFSPTWPGCSRKWRRQRNPFLPSASHLPDRRHSR